MRIASVSAALVLASVLTAFGGDESGDDPSGDPAADASQDVADMALNEDCVAAFPMAVMESDLAEAELLPDDFPAPPVDATFCVLTGNGSAVEELGYVTDVSPEDVVDAYVEALSAYDAAPSPDGTAVEAHAGDVRVLVLPKDGSFIVQLGTE